MKKILILIMLLNLWVPIAFALPTAESETLSWDAMPQGSTHSGFYIYYTPRDPTLECREHTTYTNTGRKQLPDPAATSVNLSVLAIGKLHELCFALTAYDAQGQESDFAERAANGTDYGWTGMIGATEFTVQ